MQHVILVRQDIRNGRPAGFMYERIELPNLLPALLLPKPKQAA